MEYISFVNTKTWLLLFIGPFLLLLCSSCGECSQKIDCPGFTDTELLSWFPYQRGEQIVFANGQNVRDTFSILLDSVSGPYQQIVRYGGSPDCYATRTFASAETDSFRNTKFYLQLAVASQYKIETKSASVQLRQTSLHFQNLSDTGFAYISIRGRNTRLEKFPQLTIGSRLYNNAYVVTRDTTFDKTRSIYKVFFAKGAGIVGYAEYPSLQAWVKL